MKKEEILQAIFEKNLDIFETSEIESFLKFSDETGNNVFHLLARNSDKEFVKLASTALLSRDDKLNDLLLNRNKNDELPAYFPSGEQKDTSRLSEVEKANHDIYVFLKRLTKSAYYQRNQGSPYDKGVKFEDGIPLRTVEMPTETGFMTSVPSFMTIRLVKNEHDETREKGLNPDENDTSFINFSKTVKISEDETKENIGEFIELKNVPLTNKPLSTTVRDMLLFPEDYEFAMRTLDIFDEQIKQGFNKEGTTDIIQNFFENGGVIHIKDKNEKNHLTTSFKQRGKDASVGSFYRRTNSKGEEIPFVSLLASDDFSRNSVKRTVVHELTHSADRGFSNYPIVDYFLTIQAGRKETPPNLKNDLDGIARSYKIKSFNREALAYINSAKIKDPLTEEFCKLFENYTKAINQNNFSALELLMDATADISNARMINNFNEKFKKHIETDKNIDFANFTEKMLIDAMVPTFTQELKKINTKIGKELSPNNMANESINGIINNNVTEKNVKDTFENTLQEIDDVNSVAELNNLLRKKLKEYETSDNGKLKLFEIGIISSELRQHVFPDDFSERCPYEFDTEKSFRQIQNGDFFNEEGQKVNRELLKYANKMNNVVNDFMADKSISKQALNIALNTTAKAKDIDMVLKNAENRMNGLNDADTLRVFNTYLEKAKPYISGEKQEKQTANIIGLIKVAEITFSRLKKEEDMPYFFDLKEIDPYTLDPSLNRGSVIKDSDFIKELESLANIKIKEERKPYNKTWDSGNGNYVKLLNANNNTYPNNIPINKGPQGR